MKRNVLLICASVVSIILITNSIKKLQTFRSTSQSVQGLESRLEKLKQENESLKKELEYKKSNQFAEEEIRNKLGMSKEGETVIIVPKKNQPSPSPQPTTSTPQKPNWQKWVNLFFAT